LPVFWRFAQARLVNVFSFACRDLARTISPSCDGYAVRPFSAADSNRVADLVASTAAASGAGGPAPRPSGLLAELQSRPGRGVSCWLAWRDSADANGAAAPCGLVTLVHALDRTGRPRWSIGWLIVHPTVRRQGLGRGLVAFAVRQARVAGAEAVRAETSASWPAAAFWQAVGFTMERSDG